MSARKSELGSAAGGGAVAGVIGGLVLYVWLLLVTLGRGADLWMVFKGSAAPFLGERAMAAGFDALALAAGVAVHMAISVGWGILFGLVAFGWSRATTVLAGVPFGVLVWLVMFYLALPIVGMGEMARSVPVGLALFEHVLFGLAVAAGFLPFQRRVARPAKVPA
ncbi:MAG: hypothetical protein HYZ28_03120 [Myxococcales bacterium]|nr:hypothetical protein [Myxococcales bacterium]